MQLTLVQKSFSMLPNNIERPFGAYTRRRVLKEHLLNSLCFSGNLTHFKLACRDCPGKCEEDQGRMSRSQARPLVVTKFVRHLAPVPSTQQGSSLILAAWLTAFT